MTKKQIVIPYKPNPKQNLFHASNATETLYGGAKGGGKSCALVIDASAYAMEYPKAKVYLFRETYDTLEANLIDEFKKKIPQEIYKYSETKHIATFPNGSKIFFRYVRNEQDAEKYAGREMDYLGIDEVTKHTERTVQILLSCMRSALGYPTRGRFTANPGSQGHYWVKKKFIDGTDKGAKTYQDPVTKNKIEFIPATVYDNYVLMENDPAYIKRLENLPEAERQAFLLGSWDIFEGLAFDKFSRGIHVIKSFQPPTHWRKWRAADNGYTDPFAWYWYAVDEHGTVHVYREYTREREDEKVTYTKQAEKVVEYSSYIDPDTGEEIKEDIDYTVVGHDAWSRTSYTKTPDTPQGKSILDYYSEGGLHGFIKPITDRRLRKATIIEYLEPFEDQEGELTAKVLIHDCCKKLIEVLPLIENDEKDPEKYDDNPALDHWVDAFGYGLLSYHVAKSKGLESEKPLIQRHKESLIKKLRRKKRRAM